MDKIKYLKRTNDKKKAIKSKDVFIETNITVNSIGGLGYLIFCYENIRVKYGMVADDLNLLLYLHKLHIFSLDILIIDKSLSIRDLKKREYVVSDYSLNNKRLYRLSEKGLIIINQLNKSIQNTDDFIKYNRKVDIDLESKMKSVLKSYGNKIK